MLQDALSRLVRLWPARIDAGEAFFQVASRRPVAIRPAGDSGSRTGRSCRCQDPSCRPPTRRRFARRAEIVADMRVIVPGRRRGGSRERDARLRERRADRLSPAAAGRRAAGDDGAGLAHPAILPRRNIRVVPRGSGTSLSGGALPLADGVLLVMSRFNRILDIDYANRTRDRAAGRHQSRHHQGGRRGGLLLRARPLLADRLLDRRQRRGEFRRRALPEIRADREQRARHRDGADRRRGDPARRQASRCGRLRSARPDDRLGGAARRRHRSDGAHPAEAGDGARGADRLSRPASRRGNASPTSSAPASFPAAWR